MTSKDNSNTDESGDKFSDERMKNGRRNSSNFSNVNHSTNWFRSIPKRFRRFITKHRYNGHSSTSTSALATALATNLTIDTNGDESTLYSAVDQFVNDEEVAMIRACSQMAR